MLKAQEIVYRVVDRSWRNRDHPISVLHGIKHESEKYSEWVTLSLKNKEHLEKHLSTLEMNILCNRGIKPYEWIAILSSYKKEKE